LKKSLIIAIFISIVSVGSSLKAGPSEELYKTVLNLDKMLFEAFNSCDLAKMSEVFDQNLEFYHDKGGLTNYQDTLKSSKRNCDNKLGLERVLLKDSTKIFPIGEYGAIQEGRHRFCHMENGKNECGVFTFIHIWKKVGQRWTLSRVISYDH